MSFEISPVPTDEEAVAISSAIAAHIAATEAKKESDADEPTWDGNRWQIHARIADMGSLQRDHWKPPVDPWKAAGRFANR